MKAKERANHEGTAMLQCTRVVCLAGSCSLHSRPLGNAAQLRRRPAAACAEAIGETRLVLGEGYFRTVGAAR